MNRYLAFGGLEKLGQLIDAGTLTISRIARETAVSSQTVRNDLKRHFGLEWYKEAIKRNQKTNKPQKPIFGGREISADEAIQALKAGDRPCSEQEAEASIAAVNALVASKKVAAYRIGTRGLSAAKSTKGWTTVRLFTANPNLKEFKMGLYRMRPIKGKSDSGLSIYGIFCKGKIVFYVFTYNDTSKIYSLNLRFECLNRNSKYSFARDRWDIL